MGILTFFFKFLYFTDELIILMTFDGVTGVAHLGMPA